MPRVFQPPWDRVLHSIESIAASHQLYVSRIEKDVEHSLRGFQSRPEVAGMQTFVTNMQNMAKELDDSQTAADKANKKGGKKAEAANTRLETATQQWESQAPFIYESLQALDEQRTNHLRDLLTQLQTHEVDQASRTQASAEEALNMTLEVDTAQEIQSFASRTVAGKPKQERRAQMSRQTSAVASTTMPPSSAGGLSGHQDDATNSSEHSGGRLEPPTGMANGRSFGDFRRAVLTIPVNRVEVAKQAWHNARTATTEHPWIWAALASQERWPLQPRPQQRPRAPDVASSFYEQFVGIRQVILSC